MKAKRTKAKIRAEQKAIAVPCSEPAQELQILRPDAAGIDCGAQEHYIAVPPERVSAGEATVRRFSAFTEGLDAAVEWLKACRVTTVAMEATGIYWIPLHQKLEAAGIEVYLVNAGHVRHVPGRKSDVQDGQWLRQLHRFGLLNASFRPEDIICRLRSLHRHRDNPGQFQWLGNPTYAESAPADEPPPPPRSERYYRGERIAHYRCDPGRSTRSRAAG
jgi:hypothetical protein